MALIVKLHNGNLLAGSLVRVRYSNGDERDLKIVRAAKDGDREGFTISDGEGRVDFLAEPVHACPRCTDENGRGAHVYTVRTATGAADHDGPATEHFHCSVCWHSWTVEVDGPGAFRSGCR